MHKALDQDGPFERTAHGTLTFASMIRLKKIIARHTYTLHKKRREETLQERIELLNAKREV